MNNTTNNTKEIDNVLSGYTGGEWNMYISEKGKDGISRAYINSALPKDMYETICTLSGLNGNEAGETAKANAKAICNAVNNTYQKGINPESVPLMLEALKELHHACMMDSDIPVAWWKKYSDTVAKAKEAINKATL